MTPPPWGAKIRMYRHGFGDCFLIAFPTDEPEVAFFILIDCGLFWSYPRQTEKMRDVAADIRDATSNEIDVLLITHEHFDHLAGFRWSESRKLLEQISFGELWLAWTEDPRDTTAEELRDEISLGLRGLKGVIGHLGKTTAAAEQELLEFSKNTDKARQNVLSLFPDRDRRYLSPGDILEPLGGGGPRVYTMGPPKDRALLRLNFREDELYAGMLRAEERAFLEAAAAPGRGATSGDSFRPFRGTFELAEKDAREMDFFRTHYGFVEQNSGEPWRRIDEDWHRRTAELALQYDNYINNTSLVIAIELPYSQKVLLFPGDAQAGNWLSWCDEGVDFSVDGTTVSSKDLVRRTCFYKVSHHGSHNATLRQKGLEQMRSPDLVAMIPTDEKWAWETRNNGWKMPYLSMYQSLVERTRGKVIQSDTGLPTAKKQMTKHPRTNERPYSRGQWNALRSQIESLQSEIEEFSQSITSTSLYFELTVDD